MSDYTSLIYNAQDAILTLTLNRPDCLNAFDDTMSAELLMALKAAEKDKSIRCVVLTGAGRAFSAGQDLRSRSVHPGGETPHLGDSIRNRYSPLILKLQALEKPVIAKVNGIAAGAGASLALACDFRIAGESAAFIQAFSKVGLIPDSGALWFLPRMIGMGRTMELALLGDKVNAARALEWGLINRLVPDTDLADATHAFALQLAQGPTYAYALMKRGIHKALQTDLATYLAYEADLQEIAGRTDDYREGVQAFLEKRPAGFQGR